MQGRVHPHVGRRASAVGRRRTAFRRLGGYDGTPHPWEFKRVWHLEPAPDDPDTVYAGVEDAALFRSRDGGSNWEELPGLRGHDTSSQWQPGAGGMCLHTVLLDPSDRNRMYVAISAAGVFRTDDGGQTWRPVNRGLKSPDMIADPEAAVGHCVHRLALHPSRPNVLYMQKHWDVMRSDDADESWHEISGNLPSDFGFPIEVHAHEPDTLYVVPITSESEHYPPDGKLRVYRGGDQRHGTVSGGRRHGGRLARSARPSGTSRSSRRVARALECGLRW